MAQVFKIRVLSQCTFLMAKSENTVWRVFAHGEWQFMPDWRLNAGTMDEHDDYAGN
ncbi:MAG: hypothetical protein U1E94_07555 [Agitococcus sp.]